MFQPLTRHQLFRLKNEIPVEDLLRVLDWLCKVREGRFCFVCHACRETLTAVNPSTNLGRCFRCEENFNPIDLVMRIRDVDFVEAVYFLEKDWPRIKRRLASSARLRAPYSARSINHERPGQESF